MLPLWWPKLVFSVEAKLWQNRAMWLTVHNFVYFYIISHLLIVSIFFTGLAVKLAYYSVSAATHSQSIVSEEISLSRGSHMVLVGAWEMTMIFMVIWRSSYSTPSSSMGLTFINLLLKGNWILDFKIVLCPHIESSYRWRFMCHIQVLVIMECQQS